MGRSPLSKTNYDSEVNSRKKTEELKQKVQFKISEVIKQKEDPEMAARCERRIEKSQNISRDPQSDQRNKIKGISFNLSVGRDREKRVGSRLISPKIRTLNSTFQNSEENNRRGLSNLLSPSNGVSRTEVQSPIGKQAEMKSNIIRKALNSHREKQKKDKVVYCHDPVYQPNFEFVMKRSDMKCLHFGKTYGREDLPYPLVQKNIKLREKILQVKDPPLTERIQKGSRFGSFDLAMPREKNTKSTFPAWMQKGNGSGLFIQTFNEKALETNGFFNVPSQSTNQVSPRVPKQHKNSKSSKFFTKNKKMETSSSSDLEIELEKLDKMIQTHELK